MGNCSTNCNPCGPSYDAINSLASKTASYARQALSAVTTVEEFQSLYLGAKTVAPTTDNEGNPLIQGALYFNTTDGEMYVWAGSAWELFGQAGYYLGAKASDPTTDNEGNPLVAGLLYFNTTSNVMRVYNGTFWQNVAFDESTPFLATGTTTPRNLVTRFADVVNVLDFIPASEHAAIKAGTSTYDATADIQAAIDSQSGGKVFVPSGTYVVDNIYITSDNMMFFGEGQGSTKFTALPSRRGWTIIVLDKTNVTISDLTIDAIDGSIEGGLRLGGAINCLVERCSFLNGELGSMIVAGNLGVAGGTRIAYDNTVRDCYASGQRSYAPDGTSPFISADNAQRTTFINCVVEDCEADAFDSDNAPNTKFINCTAIKNGTQSTYAGFWSEGEQVNPDDHSVYLEGCYAQNFLIGIGTSERVSATINGFTIKDCGRAIWCRSSAGNIVSNGNIINCGKSGSTDGAFQIEKSCNISNIQFKDTQFSNCISIYNGSGIQNDETVTIQNCVVDKLISIGYEQGGAEIVKLNGCTFNNTYLTYYNSDLKKLIVEGNIFINGGISGARIKDSLVVNNTFKDDSGLLTAINLNIDSFNTYVDNNTFIGYAVVNGSNRAIIGRNKYIDCALSPDNRDYITKSSIEITTGGTYYDVAKLSNARGSFLLLVEGKNSDNACGAYLIQGASNTLGHTITTLAEQSDYGTSDKFTVAFPSGGPIQITHPTSGRVALCTLIGYDY